MPESPHQNSSRNQSKGRFGNVLLQKDSSLQHSVHPTEQSPDNDSLVVVSSQNHQYTLQNNCGSGNHGNPLLNSYGCASEGSEWMGASGWLHPSYQTIDLAKPILPSSWDLYHSTPKNTSCWCERNPLELNSMPHDGSCTIHNKRENKPTDYIASKEEDSFDK